MRYLRAFVPALLLGVALLAPTPTLAADTNFFGELYPAECKCEGSAPDFGCVMIVLQNLINLGISLGVIIFVLVAAYAGVLWMTSPIHPQNREQGRTMLINAVVGLLLTLSAWLIVDFVMKALYNPSANFQGRQLGPWNQLLTGDGTIRNCLEVRQVAPPGGNDWTNTLGSTNQNPTVGQRVTCPMIITGVRVTGTILATNVDNGNGYRGIQVRLDEAPGVPAGTTMVFNPATCTPAEGTGTTGTGQNCPAAEPSTMVAFPSEATSGGSYSATAQTVQNFMAMRAAAAQAGIDLKVFSAYRSDARQVELWNANGCTRPEGCRIDTARPCSLGGPGSNHNSGTAVDIVIPGCSNGTTGCNHAIYNWLRQNGAQWNFRNSLPDDPVHWSPSGR